MTVFEASASLYGWFMENDSFCIEKDFMKIITISETPERDRAAFLSALEAFEESSIVKKSTVKEKVYWVLSRKFSTVEQTVTISTNTALGVYKLVSAYTESLKVDNHYVCDPSNIRETDVKILLDSIELLTSTKK